MRTPERLTDPHNQRVLFCVLGPVEVLAADGSPVAVGGPRLRALLALLLLDAGRIVPLDRLVDGLYGASPPGDVANALQSQVSRLRRGLGSLAVVEFSPAGYRLVVDPDDVDVHRFARLAAAGRASLAGGSYAAAASSLREALALWRGPALADVRELPFAEASAVRLEEARLSAVEDRIDADLAAGTGGELVGQLRALVAEHPLRERPRGQLMRALAGDGRQAEALAAYEEARSTFADELGADPSPELRSLHLALLRSEPTPAASRMRGLPAQLTSLVGRADELELVAKLIRSGRLVTLVGPGGTGKTRLAVEAARRETSEVCFVDLAPVPAGSSDLLPVAAAALGLRDVDAPVASDPLERVVAALAERPVLLVLDNCEHVIEASALLAHAVLTTSPSARVLATSREALGLTGEQLCPVPRLAVPARDVALAEASAAPAVRLFVDRATASQPSFALSEDNFAAVVEICATLDGLPLAIELAAARLRSLSLDAVLAGLADRFRLLGRGGDRAAMPRHQTLSAVVEWSWSLLSAEERKLASRFTVFVGGASASAVSEVCEVPYAEDVLSSLVEKSLVERVGERYSMLETIRAFGAAQASVSDEAFVSWLVRLAEEAEPWLFRSEQLGWLARLSAEGANFQAALRSADAATGLRLVATLAPYWFLTGSRGEAAPFAQAVLEKLPAAEASEEYALCCLIAGSAVDVTPIVTRPEGVRPFLVMLWALSGTPLPPGSPPPRLGDDPWSSAFARMGAGFGATFAGEAGMARTEFAGALDGFRTVGDRWGMSQALDELAAIADAQGDLDSALALSAEAATMLEELGADEELANLAVRRGDSYLRKGASTEAEAEFERAATTARRLGLRTTLADALRGLGQYAHRTGDLPAARRHLEAALAACDTTTSVVATRSRVAVLTELGRLTATEGHPAQARTLLREAAALAKSANNLAAAAEAQAAIAQLQM